MTRVIGHSTEQANASQSVALKEATRLAVLNVLKKVAEKAANQNSSSSPASGQSTSTQLQPVSSESSSADNAPVNVVSASPLTIRSTHIQSPKALASVEISKCVEKTSGPPSKLAKESPTCPICENSPFHARSRCPVIKSGIRSMRKKIAELEKETSEEGAESRSSVILELQGIIERRTKKSRVSDVVKPIVAPDVELEFPGQEAVVATSVLSPAPAPNEDSESPVEVEVTPITPSPPAPANPKSPAHKPVSARLLLSQKSTQPALSSHVSSSQKASNSSQSSKSVFPQPKHIVEAALPNDFSGFGDVSLFTDQDLDALIRGPRLSVKNVVPNSETEDESEQEEEVILEEDVAVEDNATRNASRVEYPSSSDEGEEDEDEESPADTPMGIGHPTTAATIEEADVFDDVEDSRGDLSFQEINALGSSVEPDRTADLAVHAAVGADLASINVSGLSQGNDSKVNTDESFDGTEFQVASPTKLQAPAVVEDMNVDPIEPSDVPPASQPEPIDPIISDDNMPPAESTPKSEVVVRTRSQRNAATKKVPPKASQPPAFQSKVNGSAEAQVEDAPKPRTRSLMKITDLPVPPNPAIRVVRQAAVATPRTRRQIAQEQNKEREVTPEETEVAGRTRRAAAAKAKTPAKAPPKTPAKTPARAAKMAAKPLSKQGKAVAANGINDVRTKSAASAVSADQGHEATQVPPSSPAKNAPSASWVVLQESVPSQVDTDNAGMVDELLSSPTVMPLTSPRDHSGKGQKSMSVNGSQPDPLFILAESQQSFPYSQYPPDIPPMSKGFASPNDSDDENEVAAAVAQTTSGPTKKKFRSLTEITSQPTRFVPRFSQIKKPVSEPEGEDLYGRNGQESEESDSGSDSDDDNKPMSHIPAARRAGVSQSKKK
ncbi:hypothetical protein CVT25_013525 [Psilocybe cyanescens]|uniref:Uncharacterized protein n=1 Tax=Psilocybe cyanescens TaxID=93625 RepID=A0A409XSY6_PSICY|nr:hypothetical protein CVT25_013525 [Psilocybe cyanescens]